ARRSGARGGGGRRRDGADRERRKHRRRGGQRRSLRPAAAGRRRRERRPQPRARLRLDGGRRADYPGPVNPRAAVLFLVLAPLAMLASAARGAVLSFDAGPKDGVIYSAD